MPRITAALLSIALLLASSPAQAADDKRPPNFVVIFLDDSGWGDFEPFGKPKYKTPNVDRLAKQGCRFDNFYVPQAVCSASRTALVATARTSVTP